MNPHQDLGGQLHEAVWAVSGPPSWWLLLITLVMAMLIRFAGVWAWQANALSTVIHEGGHALISLLLGGGVRQIAITSPDSGHFLGRWLTTRGEAILQTFAGYAMPSMAGLVCASLLTHGHASWVLAGGVLVMLAVVVVTRDIVSFLVVTIIGLLLALVLWFLPVWAHLALASLVMWLLLLGEIPGVWQLITARWHGAPLDDDADTLRELTGLPAAIWVLAWYCVIALCVWHAVNLLWPVAWN